MPDPDESTYSSPPGSPQSSAAASSPPQIQGSPFTPPSKDRPLATSQVSGLAPPPNSLNERRRCTTKEVERVINIDGKDVSWESIDKYYKEQDDTRIQACMQVVHKLQEENNTLKQRPGDDYLLELETQVETLRTENGQLLTRNEKLQTSNQFQKVELERNEQYVKQLSEELVKISARVDGDNIQKHDAQIRGLRKELEVAQEENAELYDRCTILQQENDELKSGSEKDDAVIDRLKLAELIKHALVSEQDLIAIRKEVIGVSDQLNEKLELRMRREGSMFFDHADFNYELEAQTQEMEDLKQTIKSLQDEVEELRKHEESHNSSHTTDQSQDSSLASSLDEELDRSFSELVKELEFTKDQLDREKAYSKALKDFKEKSEQATSGDTFNDLEGKIQQMDDLVVEWKNKVMELQLQLELLKAWLYKNGVAEDIMDTETLADRVHSAIQGCGKMVILSNDIQTINQQAKEEFTTTKKLLNEKIGEEPESYIATHETVVDRHISNDQQQTRPVVAEWKSSMDHFTDGWERLFSNLFLGVTDEDDDLLWPSSPMPETSTDKETDTIPRIIGFASSAPSRSIRAWTEMICGGKTYWTDIAVKDRILCVKISGPPWWSLVIQILALVLVFSVTVAWWCIMMASAERQLWLDANQITMKKYWDTSVWGSERGLLWKICYGLGYI